MIAESFKPRADYGPANKSTFKEWKEFKREKDKEKKLRTSSEWKNLMYLVLNLEHKIE